MTDYTSWLGRAGKSDSTRPIDTLRFAASKPPVFRPGAQWGYSNTNYIALGLVIEKVTGHTYGDELAQRLLEPLELEHTELPTTRRVRGLDDPGENPNVSWAAGALVSDTGDLVRFFSALLSGRVLPESWLAEMKRTVDVDGMGTLRDGLGIFSSQLPCGRFWGHGRGILAYGTLVRASEEGDRVAVVSVHGGTMSGPPPDEGPLLCRTSASG